MSSTQDGNEPKSETPEKKPDYRKHLHSERHDDKAKPKKFVQHAEKPGFNFKSRGNHPVGR